MVLFTVHCSLFLNFVNLENLWDAKILKIIQIQLNMLRSRKMSRSRPINVSSPFSLQNLLDRKLVITRIM